MDQGEGNPGKVGLAWTAPVLVGLLVVLLAGGCGAASGTSGGDEPQAKLTDEERRRADYESFYRGCLERVRVEAKRREAEERSGVHQASGLTDPVEAAAAQAVYQNAQSPAYEGLEDSVRWAIAIQVGTDDCGELARQRYGDVYETSAGPTTMPTTTDEASREPTTTPPGPAAGGQAAAVEFCYQFQITTEENTRNQLVVDSSEVEMDDAAVQAVVREWAEYLNGGGSESAKLKVLARQLTSACADA